MAASSPSFVSDVEELWFVPFAVLGMLVALAAVVRIVGVRSLSKMMSFDFAVTVSLGSLLASIATRSTPLVNGVVAVVAVLGVQALLTWLRQRHRWVRASTDNAPLLLMDGPTLLVDNVRAVRMTPSDVYAKLRLNGVGSVDDVAAVVLETTGDVSVLTVGSIDDVLLSGVRREVG